MKVKLVILGAVVLLIALCPIPVAAELPPAPNNFHGTVTIGGCSAPDGFTVSAKIDGVEYDTAVTVGGRYGDGPEPEHMLKVPGDDPATPQKDGGVGGVDGDTVEFFVEGVKADQIYKWQAWGYPTLNLTVPSFVDYYTVTSASYTPTVEAEFTITVTAYDLCGNVVTTDFTTQVTMTSSSGTMLFDADGDGSFDDNVKTLSSGSFDIAAKDTVTASGVTITATDGNGKTGTSLAFTISEEGATVLSFIYFYTVTSTSDSYAQTVGAEFTVTVTACDPSGEVVTADSATQVTMTSSSGTMLFDANGDGSFDDNMKTLSSGSFDIAAKDAVTASGVTITATDDDGKTGTSPPFTVTGEPTVTGVNPDQGNQGETLDVTMTGTNFTAASAVDFGAGITVNSFTVLDSTRMTANITIADDATTGARDVSVTTPGGTGTLSGGFTVTGEPTVTGVNPDQGNQGETLDVTTTGTNFTAASAVDFGAGITVNSFTVLDSTRITANITIADDATTGARDVSVTIPGGTGTLSDGFTVTGEPTVTGVNPDQGNQGETLDVTMTGTNFTAASAVDFGAGITVNSFTVLDSTRITANITIADDATTGARDVSVTIPAGTGTLSDGFTVEEKNGGDDGGLFDCVCGSSEARASATELLIGWGAVGVCCGSGYYVARRLSGRRRE